MSDSDDPTSEREAIAERLRRIREAVRDRAAGAEAAPVLPAPLETWTPEPVPSEASPEPPAAPVRPDAGAVNALWETQPAPVPGLLGRLARRLHRLLAPWFGAQVSFNARQVQLDNEILDYVDARFETTHRHYDTVLGIHGRHMGEVDERHLILQEELVAHVHDLVRRIDLVLSEAERGRLSLEFALREVRSRLARLEEALHRE